MKQFQKLSFSPKSLFIAGLALLLLPALDANAQRNYDPRLIGMLPPYCKHTQGFRYRVPGGDDRAEIDRWNAIFGPTFHAMHHYCWGLVATNRALYFERDQRDRRFQYGVSIGEFDYVIRHAPPDFVLLPEIFTKKGESLVRLGQSLTAVPEFLRAIELKPDYWPPYAQLADLYKTAGDVAKAREWLEKGLAHSPDAKQLKTRLAELEGAKGRAKSGAEPAKERKATRAPEPKEATAAKPAAPAAAESAASDPAQEALPPQPSAGR